MYSTIRMPFYGFLWIVAIIVLAETADRIHFTNSVLHYYDNIIVALLTTAILTVLWAPIALFMAASKHARLRYEMIPLLILWIMWLVETAIATNKWPARRFVCPAFASRQCNILFSSIAFSWIAFGLTSFLILFVLMEHAAKRATKRAMEGRPSGGFGHQVENKTATGTTPATGAGEGRTAGPNTGPVTDSAAV
ncbi:hypothetical protein BD410DRAFT_791744 [Rickenella mellea]|uniref:MARVEL domain-containing protein n=1 Tax=Rickenella mellea TaxID=50990 RepID=A0A4Y7PWR8_9AGAM|nr:hypothetical protein BD410DRAFT_791744 [Rickenella mellea]